MPKKNTRTIPVTNKFWLTLDNAAKIFPAVINDELTSVFRLSAVLKHPVRIGALQKAVLKVEERYPYFRVQLKEGFFWYYLEHLPVHIPVEPDIGRYCKRFERGSLLLRFLARDNILSAEFSHILTDGSGAFEFFKTTLIHYISECEMEVPPEYLLKDPADMVHEEEYEDAYKRYFRQDIPPMIKRSKAFHIPFRLKTPPRYSRLCMIFPLDHMKQIATEKGVSITVYLASVYLYTLQRIYEDMNHSGRPRNHKKLRIQIPVDLRNILPSKTMRNFSLFVMPEIDLRLGHYSFEEIIKVVYHQVQLETDEKLINKNISRNVGSEKKLVVRGIPLFLKSMILRATFYSLGTSQYSGVITNLGKIAMPGKTGRMIDYFVFTPPPPNKMLKINCGIIGFGNKLVLSFGNVSTSGIFEQNFLQFLKQQSASLEVETFN
ncbi:MAG TPA: hypothetical protein VE870_05140 [Bacteroidales bacterium]|nr:hypothetical protein [Bacteroidales bacterium]